MVVSTGTHSQQFGGLSEGVCPVGHAAQRTFEQGPAPMLPVDVSVVPLPVAVPVVPWSPVPPVAHAQSTSRPIMIANFCNLLMGPPIVDSST